jgi:hypothetical protein
VNPADPLYPCSIVAEKYDGECYRIQTALVLSLNKYNFARTARTCDSAPVKFRRYCYESFGRDIAGYVNYDLNAGVQLCQLSDASLRGSCYVGLAQTFVDESAKPADGFAVCNAIPKPGDRPLCFAAVGELLLSLEPTTGLREAACMQGHPEDTKACRKGARLDT